jgi:pathogenesis-related protein 1
MPLGGSTAEDVMDFLRIHNEARAAAGVPPLQWHAELVGVAEEWARELVAAKAVKHRTDASHMGESVFWSAASNAALADAARDWVEKEGPLLGERNEYVPDAGHFTQMIWGETRFVGAALARTEQGDTYIVANYFPPGNVVGAPIVASAQPVVARVSEQLSPLQ